MPLVRTKPVSMSNGDLVTEFVDSVGTTETTYTFPSEQNYLYVKNEGNAAITLKVNGLTKTINPNEDYSVRISFTLFSLISIDKTQQVNVRVIRGELTSNPSVTALKLARDLERSTGIVSVASRGKWYGGTSTIVEGEADVTFRSMHEALCDLDSVILMYGNFYNDGRTTSLGEFTINVSIDIGTYNIPLFFDNGSKTKRMALGARAVTDELRFTIAKGTKFFVRTHIVANVEEKRPNGLTVIGASNPGEGLMSGDVTTGTFTSSNNNPYYAYTPLVILGEPSRLTNFKTVGLCGDSISVGAGHTNSRVDNLPIGEVGYMQIGALRAGWGYVSAGMNGQKASDFAEPTKRINQMQMLKNCDLVIVEYGTNDLATASRTFEQIRDNLLAIHQTFWSMGIPTAQTTISPQTTSTDSWATLEKQTVLNANFAPGGDSARGKLNRWIMNNTDGIVGIDVNPAWESSPESGLWSVSPKSTTDGVHPNNYGHDNYAANAIRDFLLSH